MLKFLKNILIILLPCYITLYLLAVNFKINNGLKVDPLEVIHGLSNFLMNKYPTGYYTNMILTVIIVIVPSYISLFIKLTFFKKKGKIYVR